MLIGKRITGSLSVSQFYKGEQGPEGPQGPQGPQGEPGEMQEIGHLATKSEVDTIRNNVTEAEKNIDALYLQILGVQEGLDNLLDKVI